MSNENTTVNEKNAAGREASELNDALGAEPNYCDDCQQDGTCVACSCCPNEDDDSECNACRYDISRCKWFSEDFASP